MASYSGPRRDSWAGREHRGLGWLIKDSLDCQPSMVVTCFNS